MFSSIIVALDISEINSSQIILQNACSTALKMDAELHLVYVQSSQSVTFMEYTPWPINEEKKIDNEKILINLVSAIPNIHRIKLTTTVRTGAISKEVIAEAIKYNSDCIIMGSLQQGVKNYLGRSLTEEIIRNAPCSVLLVKISN